MISKFSFLMGIALLARASVSFGYTIHWVDSSADRAEFSFSCRPLSSYHDLSDRDLLERHEQIEAHSKILDNKLQKVQDQVNAANALPFYLRFTKEQKTAQIKATQEKTIYIKQYRQLLNESQCLDEVMRSRSMFSSAVYPEGGSVLECMNYPEDLRLSSLDDIRAKVPADPKESQCLDSLEGLAERKIERDVEKFKADESSHPL